MSQIGNKLRMGFFATPEAQGEYIKQLLDFQGDCSVFDPTCGEGAILHQLTKGQREDITISTYGVEIDKGRALKAKEFLTHALHAPIESMVISNDVFSMVWLNPPYDFAMKNEDERADRKEYIELVRNTRYLAPNGVMVYVIPSYRFSDEKIARFLATHFDNVGILRFSDEDYDDFKQCYFIGTKKGGKFKEYNPKIFEFLTQMESEEFVKKNVTPINHLVGRHKWKVPTGRTEVKTFYTKLEGKDSYYTGIQNSKGFQAFMERSKPRTLELGGDPIINLANGQIALLLASGAINGLMGKGDNYHAVQGLEMVSKVTEEEKHINDDGSTTIKEVTRTKREISIKFITPQGLVRKLV
ncbi:DUF6094 domain-containing protein [Bacillus salitolerans]|uniref:DUF6094 domain-containing protein n=1 Tax=Bacillus salitolerans TaxID=1437434 RepID=A0ABW4LNC0_9BACI